MGQHVPIYTSQEDNYKADSCQRLAQAHRAGEVQLETLVHGHYPGRVLPRSILPGLKSVGFWDAREPQDWGLDWHQNEGIELCLQERGMLEFAIEGQDYRLKSNDLTITRPWQRHRLGDPNIGPGRLHWLIIDLGVRQPHETWRWPSWIILSKSDLEDLTHILRHNEQPVWQNATQVGQCYGRIAQAVATDQDGSSASWLTVLINELLLHVLDLLRSHDVALDERLSDTQRTVELFFESLRYDPRHLAAEWTVGHMAKSCGLGVTRFTEYCRRLTNTTPMRYLNRVRLEFAVSLLGEQQEITNLQLAERCGFSSANYFTTVFRRNYGCTPQQYRTPTSGDEDSS